MRATAPGKIILLGEYAVLEGATAIAVAVDREVRVDLAPVPGAASRVSASPAPRDPREFVLAVDEGLRWLDGDEDDRGFGLVRKVLEHSVSRLGMSGLARNAFDVHLDSSGLFRPACGGPPVKLGLGSSAALTVALATGLRDFAGLPALSRAKWLPLLVDIHRAIQSGRGSGIDVAASLYGGIIAYDIRCGAPVARPVTLPSALAYRFVWTGKPASTTGMLRSLAAWRAGNAREYDKLMDAMRGIAKNAVAAARTGDCAAFLDEIAAYSVRLQDLGKRSGIEIYSPPHRTLAALAIESGLVYKPCGAGGGDLGVILGADAEGADRLAARAEESGYPPIDISISPDGVRTIGSF